MCKAPNHIMNIFNGDFWLSFDGIGGFKELSPFQSVFHINDSMINSLTLQDFIAAIKDKFDDWREFLVKSLTGARTAPSFLLDKVQKTWHLLFQNTCVWLKDLCMMHGEINLKVIVYRSNSKQIDFAVLILVQLSWNFWLKFVYCLSVVCQLQPNVAQNILGGKGIQVCKCDKLHPFPRGDNWEIIRIG